MLIAGAASAATITIDSVTPSTEGAVTPVFGANSPFTITRERATFSKLSGTGNWTASGETSSIILTVVGSLSDVSFNDVVGLDYDFTFNLMGGGEVNWTIVTAIMPDQGFAAGLSIGGPQAQGSITSESSERFMDSDEFIVPDNGTLFNFTSANFTATITAEWTGAADGDTLELFIPTNSIDFRTEPVPEPSSALLLSLSGLMLFRRKRG